MRSVSEETVDLLKQLAEPAPRLWGKRRHAAKQVELLREIGRSGEPAVLADIHWYLVEESQEVATEAARAVRRLLEASQPGDLLWLDQRVRGAWWYDSNAYGESATDFQRLALERLGSDPEFGFAVCALGSIHPSGHVREAAVRRLDKHSDGSELPYLLVRLTDWVREVETVARRAVKRRAVPENIPRLVDQLEIIAALPERQRAWEGGAAKVVLDLLTIPDAIDPLKGALSSPRRAQRRTAARLLIEHAQADLDALVHEVKDNPDSIIRLRVMRVALKTKAAKEETLRLFLADNFAPLRGLVLGALLDLSPRDASELATAGLMDGAAAVRREAQWYFQQRGDLDLTNFYVEHLIDDRTSVVRTALKGLGQIAAQAAIKEVQPFLTAETPSLVRTAVEVLAGLSPGEHDQQFMELLLSEKTSISCAARRALIPRVQRLSREALARRYEAKRPEHVRWNILMLSSRLSKWDALPSLLRFVASESGGLHDMAVSLVWRWHHRFNRSQISPNQAQVDDARLWLGKVQGELPDGLYAELSSVVAASR